MDRRTFLSSGLGLGVVSLATGLPPLWLRSGIPTARAGTVRTVTPLILSMSQEGDPINNNAPGSYVGLANHPDDPDFAAAQVAFGSQTHTAAAVWGTLPEALRAQSAIIHHRTLEVAHNGFDRVTRVLESVTNRSGPGSEALASAIAQENAVALGALQEQPVCLGLESLVFDGGRLAPVTPSDFVSLFASQTSTLADLRPLREQVLDSVYGDLRKNGTPAQRAFLDEVATSRNLALTLGENVAALLEGFDEQSDGNGPRDQIKVAVALAAQRVAPVITINIPFGADNHIDPSLEFEASETENGMDLVIDLWDQLGALKLQDSVTFGMLNVFGRTYGRENGRDHNPDHNVLWMFGPNVVGGVVGGLDVVQRARGFDTTSGAPTEKGIPANDTLPVAGATMMAATGVPDDRMAARMPGIATISAVLDS